VAACTWWVCRLVSGHTTAPFWEKRLLRRQHRQRHALHAGMFRSRMVFGVSGSKKTVPRGLVAHYVRSRGAKKIHLLTH